MKWLSREDRRKSNATGGVFRFTAQGDPGARYRIEATTNFVQWIPVGAFQNPAGSLLYEETPGDGAFRFYRVRPDSE